MGVFEDILRDVGSVGATLSDATRQEIAIYRKRAEAPRALITAVESENYAYDRWAAEGFPPRGPVYAEAYKAHQRLQMALVEARKAGS